MFWANPPERNWKRFVVAILAVALGTAVRLGLLAGLEQRAAYVTFFPAVMAAAFYGGFPAGMLATMLSALAVSYWWIEPPGNPFIISHPMDALGMAVFVTSGVIISLLAEVTHRAWARASEAEAQARIATERIRATEALRESEERLRLACNAAKMGVFEWDAPNDRSVWENNQMYEIFGHTLDDGTLSKAELLANYVHPDDAAAFEQALGNAAQTGRLFGTVCRIRRKSDGDWRWIEMGGRLDRSNDGATLRLVGILRDITEHQRAQDVVRMRLNLLEFAVSHSLQELLQKTLDEVGVLTGSPIGFYHFVEDDQETIALRAWSTRTIEEFCMAEGKGLHYPVSQAGVWADCIRERQPVIHNDYAELAHRKGMPVGHASVIRELVVPILRSNRVVAILGIGNKPANYTQEDVQLVSYLADVAWEISLRKKTEEERARALTLAERRYAETEAVLSAIQDAVLIYDTDMNVAKVNPMFIPTYGFDPVGLNIRDLIGRTQCRWLNGHPFRLEEQPTPRALRGETVRNQRYWITRPDGAEMALETSSGPLTDGSRIIGTVTVWHDITERVQAEKALRESREDLNRAQAVAQVGSWRLNVQRNELLWSEENHRIFGIPAGTPMTYETFLSTVHPDDREYVHEKWSAGLRGEPYDIEHRLVVGGTVKWVREKAELEFDHSGKLLGGFGTTQDITRRKRTEQDLIESEARFRLLSESADRLLSSPDPRTVVHELCRKVMDHLDCQAFFNFLADEQTGRLHLEASTGIPEEEARRIEWLDYGVAVCGCAARDGVRIVAEDIRHVSDARTDLVKSYGIEAYACHPLMAEDRVIGTLSFGTRTRSYFSQQDLAFMKTVTDQVAVAMERMRLTDELRRSRDQLEIRVRERTNELAQINRILEAEVLERRRFERSLKESEENLRKNNQLLQKILDGITDPLVMLDGGGLVKMTNKAALEYYGAEPGRGILGKHCYEGLTKRDKVCPGCEYPFPSLHSQTVTFERKGLYDASRIENVTLYPVLDESGQRDSVIVRISDVTKAKLLERQLLQNEKLASLGLLTSGIAHEINNPNSFVVFNIPILRKYLEELLPIVDQYAAVHPEYELFNMSYPELREDIFALLTNMEHGAQRITRIVGVLKGFVRRKDSGEIHETDLRELIGKVVTLCRPEMKRRVRTFEVLVPEDLPPIVTDPEALEQILLNLLINASHACDKQDSQVKLKVVHGCEHGDQFVIEITDNGSGIDESLRDRIFDPFFTTKPSTMGTGLGLYICHDRVQALGGEIEVQSSVGQGSTFRIVLPHKERIT